jgi:hypothetical protein
MKLIRSRWFGLVTLAVIVGGVVASLLAGTPTKLPSSALGSVLVLDAERVAALVLAFLFIATAVGRGWRGELPNSYSGTGVGYADKEATQALADETSRGLRNLERALRQQRAAHQLLAERLARLEDRE